jgi:hypothetical protein
MKSSDVFLRPQLTEAGPVNLTVERCQDTIDVNNEVIANLNTSELDQVDRTSLVCNINIFDTLYRNS